MKHINHLNTVYFTMRQYNKSFRIPILLFIFEMPVTNYKWLKTNNILCFPDDFFVLVRFLGVTKHREGLYLEEASVHWRKKNQSMCIVILFFTSHCKRWRRSDTQVDTEEEDEQKVGYGIAEEGVRRRRWEKWDLGSTGVTKCGLFYSWKVAEAEKRIDRSTRARRKLLHIHLPVFTSAWLPAYLPEHLPARSLVLAACLPSCLPACLSVRCHRRCDPNTDSFCRSSLAIQ